MTGPFAISVCVDDAEATLESSMPQIARDTDGMGYSARNFIFTDGEFYQSWMFGLTGDWIMRATSVE